jgi:hypothetical protein
MSSQNATQTAEIAIHTRSMDCRVSAQPAFTVVSDMIFAAPAAALVASGSRLAWLAPR